MKTRRTQGSAKIYFMNRHSDTPDALFLLFCLLCVVFVLIFLATNVVAPFQDIRPLISDRRHVPEVRPVP